VRADRFRSLQQRLRREADAFEFGALIDGVSTLEPEPPAQAPASPTPEETPAPDQPSEAPSLAAAPVAAGPAEPPQPRTPPRKPRGAPAPTPPAEAAPPARPEEDRVRVALEALESRLLQASGRFRAAAAAGQAEEAGVRLADMNQILELLRSVDPTGDASRKLRTPCAPPRGRTWPRPVWTVAEFAESPLSGMLPPGAGEAFVRSVFYSAWGVEFEYT
jgi:hypothetical protein